MYRYLYLLMCMYDVLYTFIYYTRVPRSGGYFLFYYARTPDDKTPHRRGRRRRDGTDTTTKERFSHTNPENDGLTLRRDGRASTRRIFGEGTDNAVVAINRSVASKSIYFALANENGKRDGRGGDRHAKLEQIRPNSRLNWLKTDRFGAPNFCRF